MLRYTITVRTPFTKDDVILDVDDDDKCVVMMMLLFSLSLHTIFYVPCFSLLLALAIAMPGLLHDDYDQDHGTGTETALSE